jgi:hypothetical protein
MESYLSYIEGGKVYTGLGVTNSVQENEGGESCPAVFKVLVVVSKRSEQSNGALLKYNG